MDETPPECQTDAEKTAYAFGYFKALEKKREWVGLTDDEIAQLMFKCDVIVTGPTQFDFAQAIEAKLKEKNGL
jgi:hypothetical protein